MIDNIFFQHNIERKSNAAAKTFAKHDFIHHHCRNDLIERMTFMNLNPKIAIDLGCANGSSSRFLAKHYKKCHTFSLDLSQGMLIESRKKRSFLTPIMEIQASAYSLPFKNNSIDLIFANLLMPWIGDLPLFFIEISRILKNDGLFIFSTLGPDSLQIIKSIWSKLDNYEHINPFIDMHIIGDQILQSGLGDPVLDAEKLTINYKNIDSLFSDLKNSGASNCLKNRNPTLTGKKKIKEFKLELENNIKNDQFNVELELIYGHAWGKHLNSNPNEYSVDISQIRKQAP
jgi:malonyl-CoA O-methyltransferase